MHLESFLAKSRIIDLKSADFEEALGELIGMIPDSLLGGVSRHEIQKDLAERENSMSTYLGNCVCLPHIKLENLSRKYVFLVGRCPQGLRLNGKQQYSNARLVFLILARADEPSYLKVLSSLAGIFSDDETMARLLAPVAIRQFQDRILEAFAGTDGVRDKARRLNKVFLSQAEKIAKDSGCTAIVVLGDTFTNGIRLANYFKGMRIVLVSERRTDADLDDFDEIVSVRSYSRIRMGQLKSAILVGITKGILSETDKVCCIGGIRGSDVIDSIMVFNVGAEFSQFYLKNTDALPAGVKPDVVERVIDIATELAVEGREGKPVGSLFVVNFKKLDIFQIFFLVPLVTVKRPDGILNCRKLFLWIKIYSAEHNADIFLTFGFLFGNSHSENFRRARIGMYHIENRFYSCAFAGAVPADEAHYLSAFNLERDVF